MGGGEHLARHTEGHGDGGQFHITGSHGCYNGHNNGHMPLAQAREHPDDEGDAGDDDGHGQGAGLEGRHDFRQYFGDGENLYEVENGKDVDEHFDVDGIKDDFFGIHFPAHTPKYEEEQQGDNQHGYGSVDAAAHHQNKVQQHRADAQENVKVVLPLVFAGGLGDVASDGFDEDEVAHGEGNDGEPGQINNSIT